MKWAWGKWRRIKLQIIQKLQHVVICTVAARLFVEIWKYGWREGFFYVLESSNETNLAMWPRRAQLRGKKYKKNYKWLLELSLIPINDCLCVCGCWAAQSCLQAGFSTCRSAKLIPWKASEEGSYLKMKREAEKWNKEYFSIHCLGGHWSVGAISIQCTAEALIKLCRIFKNTLSLVTCESVCGGGGSGRKGVSRFGQMQDCPAHKREGLCHHRACQLKA